MPETTVRSRFEQDLAGLKREQTNSKVVCFRRRFQLHLIT